MKIWTILVCMFFSLIGAPSYSHASEVDKLKAVTDGALDFLYLDQYKDFTYAERQGAIRALLEENYDLMVIVRLALARNWGLLSATEQKRVTELITNLVVKAFVEGMDGLGRPSLAFGDVIEVTSKRLEIPLVVTFSDGDVINVLYRFGRLESGWQIYDIVAENVSMVSNYRQQFDDHFRKGNGAELIKKLEKLLEGAELNGNTKL